MDQDLRVGLRGKAVPAQDQALTQLAVAVQLAVEDDGDVLGFVPDGLLAAGEVDNAQPAHPQSKARRARLVKEESFFIGTAMAQGRGHRLHSRLRLRIARSESDSADPAHAIL